MEADLCFWMATSFFRLIQLTIMERRFIFGRDICCLQCAIFFVSVVSQKSRNKWLTMNKSLSDFRTWKAAVFLAKGSEKPTVHSLLTQQTGKVGD